MHVWIRAFEPDLVESHEPGDQTEIPLRFDGNATSSGASRADVDLVPHTMSHVRVAIVEVNIVVATEF